MKEMKKSGLLEKVVPMPVVFAGLLNDNGQLGPAEIPAKKIFVHQHCTWLSKQLGNPIHIPPVHPFHPIRPLRFAIAQGCDLKVIEKIFDFIWTKGRDISDDAEFTKLVEECGDKSAGAAIETDAVKKALIANGELARAMKVFGVPTLEIRGHLFWGLDSLDFAEAYLSDPNLFDSEEMMAAHKLKVGATRKRPV